MKPYSKPTAEATENSCNAIKVEKKRENRLEWRLSMKASYHTPTHLAPGALSEAANIVGDLVQAKPRVAAE